MNRAFEKAQECWGETLPDWVEVLAQEADATSQNKVAKRIGRTGGLVSQVISNKYGAGLERVEEIVRGVLMAGTVDCPGEGEPITTDICQSWRKKARRHAGNNPQRVMMFHACRRCPVFQREQANGQ